MVWLVIFMLFWISAMEFKWPWAVGQSLTSLLVCIPSFSFPLTGCFLFKFYYCSKMFPKRNLQFFVIQGPFHRKARQKYYSLRHNMTRIFHYVTKFTHCRRKMEKSVGNLEKKVLGTRVNTCVWYRNEIS